MRSRYRANRLGFREPENGEGQRPKMRRFSGTTTNRSLPRLIPGKEMWSPPKAERLTAALVASALSQCFMTPGLLGAPSFKSSAKRTS